MPTTTGAATASDAAVPTASTSTTAKPTVAVVPTEPTGPTGPTEPTEPTEPTAASSPAGAPGLLARARADGVTGPAVVAFATALVGFGVVIDLRFGAGGTGLSLGTVVAVLAASVAAPAIVRFRSLATAAVLPPLLMAGAAAAIGRWSGQDHGTRELALDVGTTLALWAPALFGATVASVLVVLVRLGHRFTR